MGQKQLFEDMLTKNFKKLERKNQISYLRSFMSPMQEHTHTHTHTHTHPTHSYITLKMLKTKKKEEKF